MKQSRASGANSWLFRQKETLRLWKSNIYHQINPVHNLTSISWRFWFSLNLPSGNFLRGFLTTFLCIFLLSHACCMPCLPQPL